MRKFSFLCVFVALMFLAAAGGTVWGQTVTLISPTTTGLTWSGAKDIQWTTSTAGWAPGDTVLLELSSDGGVAYDTTIARNLPYELKSFRFYTTPLTNGSSYRIKITKTGNLGVADKSDHNFTINNPVSGTAYYVNDGFTTKDVYCTAIGSDANDGLSPATPRLTLQTVIDDYVLGPGDVVYIDTGEWIRVATELTLTSADQGNALAPLCFTGSPNKSTFTGNFQPGSSRRIFINGSSHITFSHLTLAAALDDGIYINLSNDIEINYCAIRNMIGWGLQGRTSDRISLVGTRLTGNSTGAVYINEGDHHLLTGNEIEGNTSDGGQAVYISRSPYSQIRENTILNNWGEGVLVSRSPNTSIQYNTVRNNSGNNLNISRSADLRISHNVLLSPGRYNVTISHNSGIVIFNNFLYGNGISISRYELTPGIFNNIIWAFQNFTYCLFAAGPTPEDQGIYSDFNLLRPTTGGRVGYWNGNRATLAEWVLASGQDGRSLTGDPLLVDSAGGDYHPQSTEGSYHDGAWNNDFNDSPALNAGRVAAASTELAGPLSTGDSTIQLVSTANFSTGPGRIQIDDNIISYTGISGNGLTGCSGVADNHPSGSGVFQPVASAYSREPSPSGDRVNIGVFGNTDQSSKSSRKSLLVTSPEGGPEGVEKWAREKAIDWRTLGTGWGAGDSLTIEYSPDSSLWTTVTAGVPYDARPYPSWNTQSFTDSGTGRIRITPDSGEPTAYSGIFVVDNTPPVISLFSPDDGTSGQSLNTALIAETALDAIAGPNSKSPYYFRIDTAETFSSPNHRVSGWLSSRAWYVDLEPGTDYYWQVRARDDADPPNVSEFAAQSNLPGSFWKFRTARILHAEDIESTTTGLRWMLDNYVLSPGDTIYVEPGTYTLTGGPLELSAADEGDDNAGVRIEGFNGEVILDGGGTAANCLQVTGDHFEIENFSATNAVSSGILVTGNSNLIQGGKSFLNGGDGVEIRGDYNTIRNILAYGNFRAGFRLSAAYRNRLENNTSSGNGTREFFLEDALPNGSIETVLLNNILSASGSDRTAIYVEVESRTGLDANYNLLYASDGADIAHWGGVDLSTFSQWTEASFQDQSSLSVNPLFVGGENYRLQSTAGSFKPGIGWTSDGSNSPGLDRGDPLSIFSLEPAPNGGRINLGAFGNTVQASLSSAGGGSNFYVNDGDTAYDFFCTTGGLPWPLHNGLSPESPLDSIKAVFSNHTLQAGDTIYVDTGRYELSSPLIPPVSGSPGRNLTFAGSPRGTILDAQGTASYCFYLEDKDNVTIGNFILANPTANSLRAISSDNLRFSRNRVVGAGLDGIYLLNSYRAAIIENRVESNNGNGLWAGRAYESLTVRGNRFGNNAEYGIFLSQGANFDLLANRVEGSGDTGIYVSGFDDGRIEENILLDNGIQDSGTDAGIYAAGGSGFSIAGNTSSGSRYGLDLRTSGAEIWGNRAFDNFYGFHLAASNCRFTNNIAYDNQNSGLFFYGGVGNSIANNSFFNNGSYEIYLRRGVNEAELVNNIISPQGLGNYALYIGDPNPDSQDYRIDYNLYSVTAGARYGYWLGAYDTMRSWQIVSRQDGHSFSADPLFSDPGNSDFHLLSTRGRFAEGRWLFDGLNSPGLNQGDPDNDYANELNPNGNRVNLGAYGNTPQASRSSMRSLAIVSPVGTATGDEKWSQANRLTWDTIGDGWGATDRFRLDYSLDGITFTTITEGLPWPPLPYPDWNTDIPIIPDGTTYQIRITQTAGIDPAEPTEPADSGFFIIDNTSPENVGCLLPPDGALREPRITSLLALDATDSPAGLQERPYYFQITDDPTFTTPQNSGWTEFISWSPELLPDTWYYWRVRARDDADPANVSNWFGESNSPGGYRTFRTAGIYHAVNIESPTNGLRWILDNVALHPGDIVYVDAGTHAFTGPLEFAGGGDEDDPIRIIGIGGEVVLDGSGMENCLVISGDYFQVENFAFNNADGSGLLINGDHNTVQNGRSFDNGGDGIEVTGDWTSIRNMLIYNNVDAGIHLFTSHHSTLENNTCSGNGTFEILLRDEPTDTLHPTRTVGSTHASLRNNILDASGTGIVAIFLDEISQTGFTSDYNLLHVAGGAEIGYWNSTTQSSFANWTGASGQDLNSSSDDPLFVGGGNYRLQSTRGSYKGTSWPPYPGDWSPDPGDSPGLTAGDPASAAHFEPAPHGGRINLGAFGNTPEASWSIGSTFGRSYYVNDSSTDYDYYCVTRGLPWPTHDGLSPDSPLDSIQSVIDRYSLYPGDTVYVDTGLYYLNQPVQFPRNGGEDNPITVVGSPRGTTLDGRGIAASGFDITRNTSIRIGHLSLINMLDYGVYADRADNLFLAGLLLQGAGSDGLLVYRTNGARVVDCVSAYNRRYGFYFPLQPDNSAWVNNCSARSNSGEGLYLAGGTNHQISNSSFRDNAGHGLFLNGSYGSPVLTDNISIANSGSGFYLTRNSNATGITATGNRSENNQDGFHIIFHNARIAGNRARGNNGIGFNITNSPNTEIFNNLSYLNLGYGYRIYQSGDSLFINNTGYRNQGEVQLIPHLSNTNIAIRNNILWAVGPENHSLHMTTSDPSTNIWLSNFNCLRATDGGYIGFLSGPNRDISTLFDWQVESGMDGSSIDYDPVFANTIAEDFHLQSPLGSYHDGYWTADLNTSPAINQGQFYLAFSSLVDDIFPASPFIDLDDASDFTAGTDLVEINGDIIRFTGKTGNRLTGVTGIATTHMAGSGVFQPVGSDYNREPEPHGERVNIGAYGGSDEASLSLKKTLPVLRPLGGEKWSGTQNLRWLAIPADEWTVGELIEIEYSTDGFTEYYYNIDTVAYPTMNYDWNTLLASGDFPIYQVRVIGGGLSTSSGVFTIDNTPPFNVGCLLPEDGAKSLPTYIPLRGIEPIDLLADLHAEPYYFQLDTLSSFTSPDIQNSGWLGRNAWRPSLEPGTTYYWRMKARDSADPPNESAFCGFTADTDGYGTFSTANVFRAADIESETTGLRWILSNRDLEPGDTIMIEAGFHTMSTTLGPITITEGGSRYSPLRIAGIGEGAGLDGGGLIGSCLILEADYVTLENVSFADATGAGLVVTGANNIIREGATSLHGGPGVEISGAANRLVNFLSYRNQGPGIRLLQAEGNRVVNVTSHNNRAGEVVCEEAPHSYLRNNILWSAVTGTHSIYVDAVSETGFSSDYNNLYSTGASHIGHWGNDQTDLADWQGTSFQDQSSLSLDPLFADAPGGDYHLLSPGGRWAGWIAWTTVDILTSPSIDSGDPLSPYYRESSPKGGRINQGAYGNTFQASRSYQSGVSLPGNNYFLNDGSLQDNVFTTAPGNDSNPGDSPSSPKGTMTGLMDLGFGEGDTAYIDTGYHNLSGPLLIYAIHSGKPGNPVALVGSPNISLIDGNLTPQAGLLIEGARHIILDRLHSANTLAEAGVTRSGYGIRVNNSHSITTRDSVISWHGQARGEGGGGVTFNSCTDISFESNRISHTTSSGIDGRFNTGITLSDNLINSNLGSGIFGDWTTGITMENNIAYINRGNGVYLNRSEDAQIRSNTVYGNRAKGIFASGDNLKINQNLVYENNDGGIESRGEAVAIINNTIYRNSGDEFRTVTPGLYFRNNIVWANGAGNHAIWFTSAGGQFSDFNILTASSGAAIGHWTTGTSYTLGDWQLRSRLDSHSLAGDPLFVSPEGSDGILGGKYGEDDNFHLQSTEGSFHFGHWIADGDNSPGLNAGNPGDAYYYETAPDGGRINIGAYGNTVEASRSSLDTLFLDSPYGGSHGDEKWSGSHNLTWSAFGPGWGPGRAVELEYTADGTAFFPIASGVTWNDQTYSTWNTSTLADGRFYQVRVSDSSYPSILSLSGRFIVDNTPPTGIGASSPANNQIGIDPEDTSFLVRTANDPLSGLNALPYYFRIDTVNTFDSPDLVTSGWVENLNWNTQSLSPDRWYYWQVAARDDADLPNVSAFGADLNAAGTTWVFKTARVYHVTEVEGANELRDVLTNKTIEQGDIIRLRASGDFEVAGTGVISPNTLTGTAALPIRIEGYNGRPLVYGDGLVDFLLDVQSYYTRVQGIDFTGSGDVGLRISGDDNIVNRCQSFEQGGAGVAVTGDHNLVKNTMSYLNGSEGVFLDGGAGNRVLNNSLYGNEAVGIRLRNATPGDLRNNISWAVGAGSFALAVDFASQTELLSDGNDLYTTEGAMIGLWDNQTQGTMDNWRTVSGQDADSINANPKFYQIALWGNREYIYDLHLRSPAIDGPSPCYNTGINLSGVVDDDYDGEDRPFGAHYDIGADEWINTNSSNNLPDYWELQYFGDLDPDRRDTDDPDGDSLNNIREYRYYTDPTNPDTDGDGLLDGYEVDIYHTNPLDPDTDWDGLDDGDEIGQGTDPTDPDTDGDGLLDGQSINATTISAERIAYFESHNIVRVGDWFMGELSVGTDPLDPDTDKDGCPDGWEVFYGLNPLDNGSTNINDGGIGDPDGDRLNNYEEYLFGTSPIDGSDPVTRYVDAASAGGNGSSWATAWNSIRNALDWKADTDSPAIVLVTGGVYYESYLELDEDHSGLALLGAHPYQRPVIDGGFSGKAFSVFNVQTAKIDSFEIRHARFSGPGGAFYLFGSSPILSNLLIHNNTASGIGRGGAIFVTGANARPLIIGNTIAKNTGYSNFGGIYVASGFPRYANNIIWHNGIDLYQFGLTTETIRYCNLGSQEGGLNIIGFAGNISREPNFRHLGADHFHLATFFGQTNPNINAGTSAELLTGGYGPAMLADYEGEGRWNYLSQPVTGSGITGLDYYDIGADEYVDTDYNTLPDWWETEYWGALGQNPTLDPDGDGLTNYEDYYYLTNPLKYDTAVSGMSDGEEVAYWNSTHGIDWPDSPAGPQRWDSDADGDGTINILDADSDGDKLIDGFSLQRSALAPEDAALLESLGIIEVAGWFMGDRTVGTDPANPDTDGDWLEDGDEVYYWVYEHNLLFPDSAPSSWDYDWDGDGVPNVLDWDSDGDLIPDGWEVFYDLDPNDDGYYFLDHGAGGDPDGDRLNNYIEYLFDTNPRDGDDPDYVVVDINGTVGIDCDYNYIKDAIAGEEGPIRIIVRSGVYPESEITPKNRMALLGEYAATTIIEPPEGRAVIFSGVDAALLDGFTIRNAEYSGPGAGVLCYAASPFISNSIISFNTSSGAGGYGAALYAMESSYPILVNNTIASNRGTDGVGGVALESSEDNIFLINNILWDNQTDLFGTQTEMVHYSNLESGLYDGVNFNLSEDPLFTDPLIGNYRLYYTSPMICAGGYPLAGGFDMDGTARPQVNCPGPVVPGPPVIRPVQESFNIGAHEAAALPSPSPSVTPTPSPSITPTPSVTPSPTPTAAPPSIPPTPEKTPFFPSPTPRVPTPPPTITPEPPAPPTPENTPSFPTRTPTPIPTATPEFTPTLTPIGYKTPTPSPTPIDFYYRDPALNSWLNLYIDSYDTYYAIGWTGDDWREITGMPPLRWYAAQWTYGTYPGQTQWSEWTYHETETQYLEPSWPTPSPTPWGYKTPTPVPDFYYRDADRNSYLYLFIDDYDTYYSIGWAGDDWQAILDMPDSRWYTAQWTYGPPSNQKTHWSEWTYHGTETQYLEPDWPPRTPTVTPTATVTPPPTRTPTPAVSPTPSVTPSPSATPTPSYAYWYSAAGATEINGMPFDTFLAINNPTTADAYVEFQAIDQQGLIIRKNDIISPESRYTLNVNEMVKGTRGEHNPSISLTVFDLTDRIIMVDRSMYWNPGGVKWAGGHNSIVSNTSANHWYLPEGATHIFDQYIHILNPNPEFPAEVQVTFMNKFGETFVSQTSVKPLTNWVVYANEVAGPQDQLATRVDSMPQDDPAIQMQFPPEGRVPVVADRTMYWDSDYWNEGPNVKWIDGHSSKGITEISTLWYLAEGATHLFDEYILVVNPSMTEEAEIKISLMDRTGIILERIRTIGPHSRYTMKVNDYLENQGHVSAIVRSLNNQFIMCERAMYWTAGGVVWAGGHNTVGTPFGAPVWYLPEGATDIFDEYILLSNPNPRDANAKVTFYFEDQPPQQIFTWIKAQSRQTIKVNDVTGTTDAISTRIEDTTTPFSAKLPLIAERAMYWNTPPIPSGIHWGSGHSTIGIPVRVEGK